MRQTSWKLVIVLLMILLSPCVGSYAYCPTSEISRIQESANKGAAGAEAALGTCYYEGEGVPKDFGEAAKWWRRATEHGYIGISNNLGTLYYEGKGVPQDYVEAAKWWRIAAEQGVADAQASLGDLYFQGKGVKQDVAEAAKWYRYAANQQHPGAQHNLAVIYSTGQGAPQNYEDAFFWASLSDLANNVKPIGEGFRDHVAADRIPVVEDRVRKWLAAKQGASADNQLAIGMSSSAQAIAIGMHHAADPNGPAIVTPQQMYHMIATLADPQGEHKFREYKVMVDGKVLYAPDVAANISQYRRLAKELPSKNGSRTLNILADIMEKGGLQTEFIDGDEIKPLGSDGENFNVVDLAREAQCDIPSGFGALPTFIFGDGVVHCNTGGERYIFGGDLDDRIEIGDVFGLSILSPGKGADQLKLGRGQDLILLEKNWGHKTIKKRCEGRQQIDRTYSVSANNLNKMGDVGIALKKTADGIQVNYVLYTSSAHRAGMESGDIIQTVDGRKADSVSVDIVTGLLRGELGTSVKVTWKRPGGAVKQAQIKRTLIPIFEQAPRRLETDYKFPDKYLNYIVFGPGISPEEIEEKMHGHWVDSKTGDTFDAPHCFNFVFADETSIQATARKERQESDILQRTKVERSGYPLYSSAITSSNGITCNEASEDPERIVRRFPVIVDGTVDDKGEFHVGNIYKGFRKWPIAFNSDEFKSIASQPGKTVLVLADFVNGKASISGCGAIIYENGNYKGVTFGALLSEAAVYAAVASAKIASLPVVKDYRSEQERNKTLSFMEEKHDYLYLLELSIGLLRDVVDPAEINPNDHYFQDLRFQCANQVEYDSENVSDDLRATILKGYKLLGTTGGGPGNAYNEPIKFALGETGKALLNLGEKDAALYTLCGLEGSESYFRADMGK